MKTARFYDEELIHAVGAYNDNSVVGVVVVRTLCGRYAHLPEQLVSDGGHATCLACYIEPGWYVLGKSLGAQEIRGRIAQDPIPLKFT